MVVIDERWVSARREVAVRAANGCQVQELRKLLELAKISRSAMCEVERLLESIRPGRREVRT